MMVLAGYSCSPSLPDDELSRSEEHTSELQSQSNLVCRLLLEKKNISHSISFGDHNVCLAFRRADSAARPHNPLVVAPLLAAACGRPPPSALPCLPSPSPLLSL